MKKPKHPCQFCEKRSVDCRRTCDPWIAYEKAHAEYLEWRINKIHAADDLMAITSRHMRHK